MNAFSRGLFFSMRSRQALTTSSEVSSPARNRRANSSIVGGVGGRGMNGTLVRHLIELGGSQRSCHFGQGFEQRLELGKPAALGVSDCSGEPRVEVHREVGSGQWAVGGGRWPARRPVGSRQ